MFNYVKKHPFITVLGLAAGVIAGYFMPALVIGSSIEVIAGQVAVGFAAGLASFGFFAGLNALRQAMFSKTTAVKGSAAPLAGLGKSVDNTHTDGNDDELKATTVTPETAFVAGPVVDETEVDDETAAHGKSEEGDDIRPEYITKIN